MAEGIGSQGGIGDLIWKAGFRQGRIDKVFALLIIIMFIGVIQDKVFIWLDRLFFPHKYQAREAIRTSAISQKSFIEAVGDFAIFALGWIFTGLYFILMLNEFFHLFGDFRPLSYIFGKTLWVINLMFIGFLLIQGWRWYKNRRDAMILASLTSKSHLK